MILARRMARSVALRSTRMIRQHKAVVGFLIVVILFFCINWGSPGPNTGSTWRVYTSVFGESQLPSATQQDLDTMAHNLSISLDVEDNFISGELMGGKGFYLMQITLTNKGIVPIPAKAWELYAYFLRLVEPYAYPYKNGFYLNKCGLKIVHMDGYLYKFQPVKRFYSELKPGASCSFRLKLAGFQVGRTDSMPNWYVAGGDLAPKIIQSTAGEGLKYVGNFTSEKKWKRRHNDPFVPFSPSNRYQLYTSTLDQEVTDVPIIPTPLEAIILTPDRIEFLSHKWVVTDSKDFPGEETRLAGLLKMHVTNKQPETHYIAITKHTIEVNGAVNPEAYVLAINQASIFIKANTAAGAFYAVQSLLSLILKYGDLTKSSLPVLFMKDAPRFPYRGLHVDVARNFISKTEIIKVMDAMAMYKLNKLHLHLSDDEGWRLQIPGIPELTTIGSQRCHDPQEEQCLMPALGSGPWGNSSGSGFYDVGDYTDILKHAVSLHIEVIPEIDMPGHSRAALKAIHAQSQRSLRTQQKAQIYTIQDDHDNSVYKSGQHYTKNVLNPCLDSTYNFTSKIIKEIQNLHAEVQPLKFFHFGGDEVAKDAWSGSHACHMLSYHDRDKRTENDYMEYFISNVAKQCAERNISVGAWEDGMLKKLEDGNLQIPFPRDHFKNKDLYVYVWKRFSESYSPHRSVLFANKGYKVILAYGTVFYFDHPYEPDPEERGLYWATRYTTTQDVWGFSMEALWADENMACPRFIGDPTDCTELKHPENIQGIQAELWTELIRSEEQVEYMLFPRLLAVAERAWHKPTWEEDGSPGAAEKKRNDWIRFTNIVGKYELRQLDRLGIKYRVPPPGAVISKGVLKVNTEFPGLVSQYLHVSADNKTWIDFTEVPVAAKTRIRTRSADGKRHSRTITVPFVETASGSGGRPCPGVCLWTSCLTTLLLYLLHNVYC